MADDARILELVENALCLNQSAEEACAHNPELLGEVRDRLDECRQVDRMVKNMFPSMGAPPILGAQSQPGAPLPEIPGYEVLAVLGRGGHGVVYHARHLKLKRMAALKMLLTGEYASPAELARFMREAEAIAALQHPNIVQIYEVGEADGRPYFTMEYVGGGSLSEKQAGAPQPAQYSAVVVESLARAIHAAHIAGIVHRDLKPPNILLSTDGTPKISDFGLARPFEGQDDITRDAARIGTPSYMAPEQVIGKPGTVGPPADIYALGATLYEMLTGRPPFRGETITETERQVLSHEPASPSRLNAVVPRDLETICLKCLQKEPTRRYESAAALADDLARFREGRPIRARRIGWAARSWRWSKRNPTGAALVVTALVLATTSSAGGIWFVRQRAERRADAVRHDTELRHETAADLARAVSFRKGFHFQEARDVLETARRRLEPDAPDDLRQSVAQALADLRLVEQLDAARFEGLRITQGEFDPARAEPLYASALAQIGHEGEDSGVVAARVRDSSVSAEIVDALDDWAGLTRDSRRRKWLFDIAREIDSDPDRNRLREADIWQVKGSAAQLIPGLDAARMSPRIAIAYARFTRTKRVEAVGLLTAVQARFPQDFWLNFELGAALFYLQRPEEALGYDRAALALRPESGPAHSAVGADLQHMGRLDEAIDQYRQALDVDRDYADAHFNLGDALRSKGKLDDAMTQLRKAIAINPRLTDAYIDLGVVLQSKNRLDEAVGVFNQAIGLEPRNAKAHNDLATVLMAEGRLDDAITQLQEAVTLNPGCAVAQLDLGQAFWQKGRLEDAIEHLQRAAGLDPRDTETQEFLCNHLYVAACAAIRETMGRRVGTSPLDETARANIRLRALDWLRASLTLGIELVNSGQGQASAFAAWQTEPVLASIRDPKELAKLPDAERDQWQRLWTDVATQIAADPLVQARARVAQGNWAAAANGYARAIARGHHEDGNFGFEHAALLLLSGDQPGYRAACTVLIERCGEPGGPRAYHVARAGTLAADGAPDASLLAQLARKELQQNAAQFWSLTEQGALAYRAGRFEESVTLFEQSLTADSHPGRAVVNWVWLALAQQRLGKTEEARRWLDKAQNWLDQYRDGIPPNADAELGLHLHNWLEANVLRKEAEALLSSK